MGTLTVSDPDVDWARYEDVVHREAPAVGVTPVTSYDPFQGDTYTDLRVRRPGVKGYDMLLEGWGGSFGSLLAGPEMLVLANPAHEEDLGPARRVLDQGGVVVFTTEPVEGDRIRISGSAQLRRPATASANGSPRSSCRRTSCRSGARARLSPLAPIGALDPMGLKAQTAGLLLDAQGLSSARGGRPARGGAGDERQRLPVRRARLPERQRDDDPAGHPVLARRPC